MGDGRGFFSWGMVEFYKFWLGLCSECTLESVGELR